MKIHAINDENVHNPGITSIRKKNCDKKPEMIQQYENRLRPLEANTADDVVLCRIALSFFIMVHVNAVDIA